jgi:hypothetical protein
MAQAERANVARRYLPYLTFLLAAASFPRNAAAEKVLANGDNWEVFSDGRAGGFASWVYGDGNPASGFTTTYENSSVTGMAVPIRTASGGGFSASREQHPRTDPGLNFDPAAIPPDQGTVNMFRVRSGFVANVFGFGVRTKITPWTTLTAYIQLWAFVESEGRQKNFPNFVDARQGYAQLSGPWGSFLAGRTRALFSRGATDIDALSAHRWGVGFPGPNAVDTKGPTVGQIGFGVLGAGFAPGLIYGTPVLAGFQLNAGIFDPIQLPGNGAWTRTQMGRPEAELTFEQKFGATGKIVLFANGGYQKVYKEGNCVATATAPCDETAYGVGYGGRFELGPVHLGLAGHWGKGLGLNYALESSDAAQDPNGNLRKFDGYYAQLQLVLGRFDLFTGWGIARVFLTNFDNTNTYDNPANPGQQILRFSVIKWQHGANAGIVFNVTPNLHFDIDFFRAEADWWAVDQYPGAKQVLWCSNGGMIANW